MSWGRSCEIWGPLNQIVSIPKVVVNVYLVNLSLLVFVKMLFIPAGEMSL